MDIRTSIETTLRNQGVHMQVSKEEFVQLVDAMVKDAQMQGLSGAQIDQDAPKVPLFVDLSDDEGGGGVFDDLEEAYITGEVQEPLPTYIAPALIIAALVLLVLLYAVHQRITRPPTNTLPSRM